MSQELEPNTVIDKIYGGDEQLGDRALEYLNNTVLRKPRNVVELLEAIQAGNYTELQKIHMAYVLGRFDGLVSPLKK